MMYTKGVASRPLVLNLFWRMDHVFKKNYLMVYLAMLTPHKKLVETLLHR